MCHIYLYIIPRRKCKVLEKWKKKNVVPFLFCFIICSPNEENSNNKNCSKSLLASGTLYANYNISMNKHKPFLQCMRQIIITDLESMNRKKNKVLSIDVNIIYVYMI